MESLKKKPRGKPFLKGNKGKPKGAEMHITKQMRSVKEMVLNAFNELQEDPINNLVAWGKRKPGEFYQIAAKLIPTELNAKVTERVIKVVRE